jgi:hypothetical protein
LVLKKLFWRKFLLLTEDRRILGTLFLGCEGEGTFWVASEQPKTDR